VHHRLINKDIAICQEENSLLPASLPQAPDNLKRGIGLPSAGSHDQENPILAFRDSLDCRIDSVALVVAGSFTATIVIVILEDDLLLVVSQALPSAVL